MPIPEHFVQIDEEGFALSGELRIHDPAAGAEILREMKLHDGGTLLSTFGETPVIVEAFDEPYVAGQIDVQNGKWKILLPYDVEYSFKLESLSLDEWDRFHGRAENSIPFVLSRKAQASFFETLEDYDDDSITYAGKRYEIPTYWQAKPVLQTEKYWTDIYNQEGNPGWNLGEPAEALKDMLPRLKLPKSRILVLGCGEGHDAAHFAREGHAVTAVDISPEALARAKKLYGDLPNLKFLEMDFFKLPREFDKSFDIVFEHTCYCAVSPESRNDLIKIWNRVLTDQGQLMGVFFAFEKRQGPPYGGTEWELRQRLQSSYQFIFWGRWKKSVARRQGKELFVFAQRKSK